VHLYFERLGFEWQVWLKSMQWQERDGVWTLVPPRPVALIHFLGGALVAAAPHLTYRWLLEKLARRGYGIIATPFLNGSLDHWTIAGAVGESFERSRRWLYETGQVRRRYLPVYGLGHSMGCKLHLLLASEGAAGDRAGIVFISFNNFSARRAVPLGDRFAPLLESVVDSVARSIPGSVPADFLDGSNREFTPTPDETEAIAARLYPIRRNLLIRFRNDDLDQSGRIYRQLEPRFAGSLTLKTLPGNHLTPLGQDVNWRPVGGNFSPVDALGQWVKQEFFYRDLERLYQEIARWLDPTRPL
jgi:hypothetical protein